MKRMVTFFIVVLAMVLFSGITYANTAGVFQLPFDEYQQWQYGDCRLVGYRTPADQIFMALNTELPSGIPQYHLAEDWNGRCGADSDRGADLYAIADGRVQNAKMGGESGGWLLIKHSLPDATSRYILYEHILDIANNPRTQRAFAPGDDVYRGEVVAHIGNGNGVWEYHLHLEMRRDNSLPLDKNPYYNPLSISTALKYSSPSLFIDDRRNAIVQNLISNQWTSFAQNTNAPSSSAYVEYNGERYSLQRAMNAGLIWKEVYFQSNGQWYYYPDITKVMFDAGNTYWLYAFVGGATLNILVPSHHFKADRAKIDMLHAAAYDMRPTHIRTETYYENLNWDSAWEWRQVQFDSITPYTVVMGHATSKSNPLGRFTSYCELISGNWNCNGWRPVDVNQLD